jgi:hypothetical protein
MKQQGTKSAGKRRKYKDRRKYQIKENTTSR